MSTRFLRKVSSLAEIENFPEDAGIGVLGGMPYFNAGGGPIPLSSLLRVGGSVRVVNAALADDSNDVHATVQAAVDAADAGDDILIAPGSYDEAVTVEKRLRLIGLGEPGAAAIAPSTVNAAALTINAATRITGVTLIGLGLEGNGTGGGLYAKGDLRRLRCLGGKYEGGAFGLKLEGNVAGKSIGDSKILGVELCWTTTALAMLTSGGADPITQTLIAGCHLHNYTADGIKQTVSAAPDLWIYGNLFAGLEDGSEPTRFLDIDEVGTTGHVADNHFRTTVLAATKLAIAAGVLWTGNQAQAEGKATGGGTSGRPD